MIKNKESKKVNGIRALMAVFLFFSLSALINGLILEYLVLNPSYWVSEIIASDMMDELISDGNGPFLGIDYDLDTDARRVLAEKAVEEMGDLLDDPDNEFDEDFLSDYYDEYMEDSPYSRSEFIDVISREYSDYKEDTENRDLLYVYDTLLSAIDIVILVSVILSVLFAAVMFKIHKNKMIPVHTSLISLIWCGITNIALWGFIRLIMAEATVSPEEGPWGSMVIESVNKMLNTILIIYVIIVAVGIVASHFSKKAVLINEEGIDEDDDDEYERSAKGDDYEL